MTRPALALAAYVAVAAVVGTRWADRGPVLCPFRRVTGRNCPACGLTRSIAATVRGDLRIATAHHRLGPVFVVAVAACCGPAVVRSLTSRVSRRARARPGAVSRGLGCGGSVPAAPTRVAETRVERPGGLRDR